MRTIGTIIRGTLSALTISDNFRCVNYSIVTFQFSFQNDNAGSHIDIISHTIKHNN